MATVNVMVTGVGGGGNGEQILKCLEWSSIDLNLYGCDMDKRSKGLAKVSKGYIVPPASDSKYISCIMEICKKNDIKALFYGSEPELKVLSDNRKMFEEAGIYIPLNPPEVIATCMDKARTMNFLRKEGFDIEKYWEIDTADKLSDVNIFPVVLKPSVGSGGSANTFIAQNPEELHFFGTYLLKLHKVFLAQEYVGDPFHEYTVGVMPSSSGECINSIAVKKNILSGLSNRMKIPNRTGRKDLGDTLAISSGISQGDIGRFIEVTEPCERIASRLRATAPINIQCRLHQGKMYVFEINPRISGTASLRAMVGYNEPEMLIREHVLGERIKKHFKYREGTIVRGLDETLLNEERMKQSLVCMMETTN